MDAISGASINGISSLNIKGMSVQMAAALVMMEVAKTQKTAAQNKISEMKEQNDKAKSINSLCDKINNAVSGFTDNSDDNKKKRCEAIKGFQEEAKKLGLDSNIISSMNNCETSEQFQSLKTSLQHAAENCNSDNQTQMVRLQDYMGQYNSYMQGANDAAKQSNQILQTLARAQ